MELLQGQPGRRWAALAGSMLALLATTILPSTASAGVPKPFSGRGMWVWYVSESGGTAEKMVRKASRQGIKVIYVKSGDAGNYWDQFSPEMVAFAHSRGIRICGWQFVYGSKPRAEASVGARAAQAGADCLVIDAETAYEGRYAQADAYLRRLRKLVGPDYPLGLSSFPYVHYHPSFPYSVFLRPDGGALVNLPQMYWRTIGTTVPTVFATTYHYNRPYGVPISPVGQTYLKFPRKQITRFRRFAWEYGAGPSTSWWSWQETSRREFRAVTRRVKHRIPGFQPAQTYAEVGQGSRGDLVVHAQELMRSWHLDERVDGSFGKQTARRVRRFQTSQGLEVSGRVDGPTWTALMAREPESVAWSRKPKGNRAIASARQPTLRNELRFSQGAGR